MCENFDELTEEDERILDNIWDEIRAERELEEKGVGKPKWTTTDAKQWRPDLNKEGLEKWMQVANEEYRRLRMEKIHSDTARKKSVSFANRKVPKARNDSKTPTIPKASNVSKVPKTSKKKTPKKKTGPAK